MSETKPTNPKDAIAGGKLDYTATPDTLKHFAAAAFLEGALKYGKFNWRHAGVRASVYLSALNRHVDKWVSGEECDPVTHVPHLANAIACMAIILDAQLHGKLTDDRPDMSHLVRNNLETMAQVQRHLKNLHKDEHPVHYTNDTFDDRATAQLELF